MEAEGLPPWWREIIGSDRSSPRAFDRCRKGGVGSYGDRIPVPITAPAAARWLAWQWRHGSGRTASASVRRNARRAARRGRPTWRQAAPDPGCSDRWMGPASRPACDRRAVCRTSARRTPGFPAEVDGRDITVIEMHQDHRLAAIAGEVGAVGVHHRVAAIGQHRMASDGQRADPRRGPQDLASSDETHAFSPFRPPHTACRASAPAPGHVRPPPIA